MAYTIEQIKEMINPYENFKEEDVFAEHATLLEELTTEEKITFANKVFLHCPAQELSTFKYEIESLRNQKAQKTNQSSSIHDIMREAFTVTKLMLSLTDPKNTNIDGIIKNEFDQDLFQKHRKLVIGIAEATPFENIITLLLHIKKLPLEQQLIDSLNSKLDFMFKAYTLLGDNPGAFFVEDLNLVDECNEHSDLLIKLIHGHENKIGQLIAENNPEQCSRIFKILEQITPKTQDQNSPLRVIHSAIAEKLEQSSEKQIPATSKKTSVDDEIQSVMEVDDFNKSGASIDNSQISPRLTEIESLVPLTPKMPTETKPEQLEISSDEGDESISGSTLEKDFSIGEKADEIIQETDPNETNERPEEVKIAFKQSNSSIDSGQLTPPLKEEMEPVEQLTPRTKETLNSLLSPKKSPEIKSEQLKTGSGISFFDNKQLPAVETACCAKPCSIL